MPPEPFPVVPGTDASRPPISATGFRMDLGGPFVEVDLHRAEPFPIMLTIATRGPESDPESAPRLHLEPHCGGSFAAVIKAPGAGSDAILEVCDGTAHSAAAERTFRIPHGTHWVELDFESGAGTARVRVAAGVSVAPPRAAAFEALALTITLGAANLVRALFRPATFTPAEYAGEVAGGWLRVNPGRPPTPLGGDGIDPWLDVPHARYAEVSRVLRHHRVEFEVEPGYIRRVDTTDPDRQIDRFVFPGAHAERIQALLDTIAP